MVSAEKLPPLGVRPSSGSLKVPKPPAAQRKHSTASSDRRKSGTTLEKLSENGQGSGGPTPPAAPSSRGGSRGGSRGPTPASTEGRPRVPVPPPKRQGPPKKAAGKTSGRKPPGKMSKKDLMKAKAREAEEAEAERARQAALEVLALLDKELEMLVAQEEEDRPAIKREEQKFMKALIHEAKGASEAIQDALARKSEAEERKARAVMSELHLRQQREMLEVEKGESELIWAFEKEEWLSIMESFVTEEGEALDLQNGRQLMEQEEQEEITKQEAAWRASDCKDEEDEWDSIITTFTQATHSLHIWLTHTRDRILSLRDQENNKRLIFGARQKTSWKEIMILAAEDKAEAKERELQRSQQEWIADSSRRLRDAIIETMADEDDHRSEILDAQVMARKKLAEMMVTSKESSITRIQSRLLDEEQLRLRFYVNQEQQTLSLKGAEEEEWYNLMYREERERLRILHAEQRKQARHKIEASETKDRQILTDMIDKAWGIIDNQASEEEYKILAKENQNLLLERQELRKRDARAMIEKEEEKVRVILQHQAMDSWCNLMHAEGQQELMTEMFLQRRELSEDELRVWMKLEVHMQQNHAAISKILGFQKAISDVQADEEKARIECEEEEEFLAGQLNVESCRIIVEENRRQVKKRQMERTT